MSAQAAWAPLAHEAGPGFFAMHMGGRAQNTCRHGQLVTSWAGQGQLKVCTLQWLNYDGSLSDCPADRGPGHGGVSGHRETLSTTKYCYVSITTAIPIA